MADAPQDEDFGKELAAAFAEDEGIVENPVAPVVENATPVTPPAPANVEEPKKDDPANPTDPNKEDEELETPPANPAKPAEEDPANPQAPETPPVEEAPKPLTEEGVLRILNQARTQEQTSNKELQTTYTDVMEAYYPEGLSNVLVDQSSGKELRTPQDVVDASGGDMSMEQATQWLMNEQYKLDKNIEGIKQQAANIAETTVNFRRDAMSALQKYEPLFKKYPQLQTKAYNLMVKQVKIDEQKGVVLQAPDVMDLYDTYLEPYQKAYEFSTHQPATNPVTPPAPATPGQADRMDESGDGAPNTVVDDPNDFAQQVTKELAKGF